MSGPEYYPPPPPPESNATGAIILLIVALFIAITSFLYGFGFIPGTVRYARRVYELDELKNIKKTNGIIENCDIVKKFKEKQLIGDNKYFSFRGGKTVKNIIRDIVDEDTLLYLDKIDNICTGIDKGNIILKTKMIDILKNVGITSDRKVLAEDCKKMKDTLSGIEVYTIIDDDLKMYEVGEFLEKMYPLFYSTVEKTCR